jgi:nucleoside-diphosphate-sugar epimerase
MKILIIGNMGYVGPGLVSRLRKNRNNPELIGFDTGYFAHCLTHSVYLPETELDAQNFGDVRDFPNGLLKGVDSVVYLAAISNDPMGAKYEEITFDVNYKSCIRIAAAAKAAGVRTFVFASSCSIYGSADDNPKSEKDAVNPLTAYAKSKVYAEKELEPLADTNFVVTCLRFATACGISRRLRLDLVLNDFVAGAIVSNEIQILSDGTPWRPLINVLDMAKAIEWAINRHHNNGGDFLIVNTGSDQWNYQVKEIAGAIAQVITGCRITVNKNALQDKRSYKVNFNLFKELAPDHQPDFDLKDSVVGLADALKNMNFRDTRFRESQLIRLKVLENLQSAGALDNDLRWKRFK